MRALLRETKRRRQATQHADDNDNDINAINSNAHSTLSSSNEGIRARQRVMGMGMGMGRGMTNGTSGQQRSNGVGSAGDNDVTRNSLADRLAKLREERKKERAMVLEWTLQDMTEDLALLHTSHSSQFASLAVCYSTTSLC
jgi:membrane protease subunit (stomatin/prohibitin family)